MPICSLIATAYGWETIFYVFGKDNKTFFLIPNFTGDKK